MCTLLILRDCYATHLRLPGLCGASETGLDGPTLTVTVSPRLYSLPFRQYHDGQKLR